MKATSVNNLQRSCLYSSSVGSFLALKTENLQVQYPCVDIYGRHRYIDFALESPESKYNRD